MTPMLRDLGIDQFSLGCESAFFVNAHQPTAAGDISRKDGRQPTFDASPRSRRIENISFSSANCHNIPLQYCRNAPRRWRTDPKGSNRRG
jgi:hypothetical protein